MVVIGGKCMTKKSFVVILILSVVLTYSVAIIDALARNSLIAGSAGLPLKFTSGYFGTSTTNYSILIVDIAFWFVVILGTWKLLKKTLGKKG